MAPKKDSSDGLNLSRHSFFKSTGIVGIASAVIVPGGTRGAGPGRRSRTGGSSRAAHGERPAGQPDESNRASPCSTRSACAPTHGQQARLRPRRLRRLHDDSRRPDGLLLFDAGDRGQGKRIRTVDGLASANGQLHPVQQAFCDKDALMCGFCTPGFVMASVGLLEKHPNRHQNRSRRVSTATSAAAAPSTASSKRCRA